MHICCPVNCHKGLCGKLNETAMELCWRLEHLKVTMSNLFSSLTALDSRVFKTDLFCHCSACMCVCVCMFKAHSLGWAVA